MKHAIVARPVLAGLVLAGVLGACGGTSPAATTSSSVPAATTVATGSGGLTGAASAGSGQPAAGASSTTTSTTTTAPAGSPVEPVPALSASQIAQIDQLLSNFDNSLSEASSDLSNPQGDN